MDVQISPDEIKRLKGLGCLKDKRYDALFNVRVVTGNGRITSAQQRAVADAADQFGNGIVTLTTRLSFEIQDVPYDKIDELTAYLKQYDLETGGTGPKVRPIVSCKGTVCQYGLIDTFELSEKLHQRFYKGYHDVKLPHKFKIAVGGCPNNCVKPTLNDIGIIGQSVPHVYPERCKNCTVCNVCSACPVDVPAIKDGHVYIDPSKCNRCGRCRNKCPFDAVSHAIRGYQIYIGGRWGKRSAVGRPLGKILLTEEDVMTVVERAILLYKDKGIAGERFSDVIERLGFEAVESALLENI